MTSQCQPHTHLHNAVPVVAGRHAEQRQEGHAEVAEVRMLAESLARRTLGALESTEQLDAKRREDEEEEEEEETEVADLRQRLHHRVEESADAFSHLKQLQH